MKMIPMQSATESKIQSFNSSKKLENNENYDSSFKKDYEDKKRVVNSDSPEPNKVIDEHKDIDSNKVNKPVVFKEKGKEEEKIDTEAKKLSETSKEISKEVVESTSKSKNKDQVDIKLIKAIKKTDKRVDNKKKATDEVKKTDKDSLNQSLASGSLINHKGESVKDLKKSDSSNKIKIEDSVEGKNIEVATKEPKIKTQGDEVNLTKLRDKKQLITKKEELSRDTKKNVVKDIRSKDNKTDVMDVKSKNSDNLNQVQEVKLESAQELEAGADRTIVLGTTEISAEGEGGKAQAPVIKEASILLKQQLKDFGNNEIVKQSRFILKDNNVGEIKLILKPEALGQVKINLNLKQNSLAGQIVVENNSVKEVFQENINQLSRALEEKGFDSAKLDVSLNDRGGSNSNGSRDNKQYFSERLKRFDDNGQVVRYGAPTVGINLTA